MTFGLALALLLNEGVRRFVNAYRVLIYLPVILPALLESYAKVGERTGAHAFLAELRAEAPAAAVVVAHGGPLRAIAGALLGLPPENWLGLDFACGEATRIDLHDWGTVLRWFNRREASTAN